MMIPDIPNMKNDIPDMIPVNPSPSSELVQRLVQWFNALLADPLGM